MPPKRYYLVRTPYHRGRVLTAGLYHSNKRGAIARAKSEAYEWRHHTPVRDRRVSVYTVNPGQRPTLLYQCHFDRRSGKIVSEVL